MAKITSTSLFQHPDVRLPGEGTRARWASSHSGDHAAVATGTEPLRGWQVRMYDRTGLETRVERWHVDLGDDLIRGLAVSDEGMLAVLVWAPGAGALAPRVHVHSAQGERLYSRDVEDVLPVFVPGQRLALVAPGGETLTLLSAATGEPLSTRPFQKEPSLQSFYGDGIATRPSRLLFDEVTEDVLSESRWYPSDGGPPRALPTEARALFHDRRALVHDEQTWRSVDADGSSRWSLPSQPASRRVVVRSDRSAAVLTTFAGVDAVRCERLDLATGALTPLSGDGRLSTYDAVHGWPSKGPALVSARGRLVRWNPEDASFVGEDALELLAVARTARGVVTLHDDGVRWWSKDGQCTHQTPLKTLRYPHWVEKHQLSVSPDGSRVLVASGSFGVVVLEPNKVVWALAQPCFHGGSWVDAQHIVYGLGGDHGVEVVVTAVETGAQEKLSLGEGRVVGTEAGGLVSAWNKGVSFHDARGTVLHTWQEKKPPKGYDWPTKVLASAEEAWVLARTNLFVWRKGAQERVLSKEFVSDFAVSGAHLAALVTHPSKPLRALLLDRTSLEVIGAREVPPCAWGHRLALLDDVLVVASALGAVSEFVRR